ncbi:MAG TPA: NAD(+)--rifampin ADP-ribosyltransferase [Flavobacteriales bacterium]|nr:NAD(+)--rifampin ADP-ribosyltransferase [Flavobacteriales bacterium]
MDNIKEKDNSKNLAPTPFAQTYFHGTKAGLNLGDLIEVGYNSNYGQRKNSKYIKSN